MKLILKNVRIAFAHGLFEARQVNGQGDFKFSPSFLIPKDHPQVKEINAAIIAVAKEKWLDKAAAAYKALKAQDRLALHDGDIKDNYAGFEGNYYISASTKTAPVIVDRNPAVVLTAESGKPYSGSYVNVSLDFWAQDNQYGKRINAALLGVQFAQDGDRLGGGAVGSAGDFEALPGAEADNAPDFGNMDSPAAGDAPSAGMAGYVRADMEGVDEDLPF